MNATITAPARSSETIFSSETTSDITETTELTDTALTDTVDAVDAVDVTVGGPSTDAAGLNGSEVTTSSPALVDSAQFAGRHANAFSISSFVLGIVSVVSGWTLVAPIVGLVLGVLALRRNTSERTLALWGVWMNIAMLALAAIAVLAFVFAVGFGLIAVPLLAA